MNNIVLANFVRFIGLLLVQGLVLRRMEFDEFGWNYIHVLVYPLFILLLPFRMPRPLVIASGFAMGILVDFFYYTPGLHASAATFLAYVRPAVLWLIEPQARYNLNQSPTKARLGRNWFLRYAAIMMGIHLLFYFSVEAFTFAYIDRILLNSLVTFALSFPAVIALVGLFNPLD